MNKDKLHNQFSSAFTLVELLVAMTVLSLLIVLVASLLSGVSRAWISGEQHVETFQDGRAIIELMSRELAQAVISPRLQLVQDASLASAANQRANSNNLFWQAALNSTAGGNLCEIGYFLAQDAENNFQLKRFFVPPTDSTNYQIFANFPSDIGAPWVTNFVTAAGVTTTLSDSVVALWIRCLDSNSDPIPWLSSAVPATAPQRFNSAARFQPAISGQSSSFKYTSSSGTLLANLLPPSIELTIVTVDSKTLIRSRGNVPPMPSTIPTGYPDQAPSGFGPEDIPNAIQSFNRQLIANNIKNARTFTTRVALKNSGQ